MIFSFALSVALRLRSALNRKYNAIIATNAADEYSNILGSRLLFMRVAVTVTSGSVAPYMGVSPLLFVVLVGKAAIRLFPFLN